MGIRSRLDDPEPTFLVRGHSNGFKRASVHRQQAAAENPGGRVMARTAFDGDK
jgi:hypothetical protein